MAYNICVAALYRIKHSKLYSRNIKHKLGEKLIYKNVTLSIPDFIRKIRHMIDKINPPSQRDITNKCDVSVRTVDIIIRRLVNARLRKTRPVHKLMNIVFR